MQTDPMNDESFKARRLDFLIEDYWQKISYLKDHFTRLWNRFNYFLTIQSALFGANPPRDMAGHFADPSKPAVNPWRCYFPSSFLPALKLSKFRIALKTRK